jgi:two-component system, LuxR family, response regulator FixJ
LDDDASVLESLAALFEAYAYRVSPFSSGQALLAALPEANPDCLISDVQMPDMDGLGLLQAVTAQRPEIPVVLITGFATVALAVKAMKLGAYDFVEKPVNGENLVALVQTAIAARGARPQLNTEVREILLRMEALTARETDTMRHLVVGHSNKGIAQRMGISPRTVEIHRARVMEKMQANSLSHLVRMAIAVDLRTSDA